MTNYKTTTHFNDIDDKEKLSRLSSSLTDPDTILFGRPFQISEGVFSGWSAIFVVSQS